MEYFQYYSKENRLCYHDKPEALPPSPHTGKSRTSLDAGSLQSQEQADAAKAAAARFVRSHVDASSRLRLEEVSSRGVMLNVDEMRQEQKDERFDEAFHQATVLMVPGANPVVPLANLVGYLKHPDKNNSIFASFFMMSGSERKRSIMFLEILSQRVWEACRASNLNTRSGQEAAKTRMLATINANPQVSQALSGIHLAYNYKGYTIEISFMPETADINFRKSGKKRK